MRRRVCDRGPAVLLVVVCLVSVALAQTSWWRVYGDTSDDCGNSVQQTGDGGYVVVGTTYSFGAENGAIYLIKTNPSGDTLWSRVYGGTGYYEGLSGQQTTDGGYIIAGYACYVEKSYYQYVYLVKTDAAGDTLWTRTYEFAGYECGLSVQQTNDGGYIVAGYTAQDSLNVYLVKTDSRGDVLWDNIYGGSGFEEGVSVQQTTDGGYIIAGDAIASGAYWSDVYLVKTDPQGDPLWTRTYGGANEDRASSVQQTSDGGYIIVGHTSSFGAGGSDVYLVKTNSQGDTLWTETFGGTSDDGGSSVRQTTDGGYIVAGTTGSFGAGANDVWLIRTSPSGDSLWTRTFGGTSDDGGSSIRQTSDGGYVISGATNSFGAGWSDVYLIKTDPNGNVGVAEENRGAKTIGRKLATTVVSSLPRDLPAFDAMGRRVLHSEPGVYFLRTGDAAAPRKVLLVK